MTTIRLHGILEKEFGKFFQLKLGKALDVLRAIDCNRKNFINRINNLAKEGFHYTLIVDGKKVQELTELDALRQPKEIDLVPIIMGSGATYLGAALIYIFTAGSATTAAAGTAAGAAAAAAGAGAIGTIAAGFGTISTFIGTIALTAISMGLQMLLAPKPDAAPPATANARALEESFAFSNKANLASQGSPVPVGYGRLRIGSQVVQFSIKSFPQNNSSLEAMVSNPFEFNGAVSQPIIQSNRT